MDEQMFKGLQVMQRIEYHLRLRSERWVKNNKDGKIYLTGIPDGTLSFVKATWSYDNVTLEVYNARVSSAEPEIMARQFLTSDMNLLPVEEIKAVYHELRTISKSYLAGVFNQIYMDATRLDPGVMNPKMHKVDPQFYDGNNGENKSEEMTEEEQFSADEDD